MDNTESYRARERQWDDQWPSSPNEENEHELSETDIENELMPFPDVVGVEDAAHATEDAEPYMPPLDPPVLPGGRDGVHVATGFGMSADEEAANSPAPRGDEDIRDQAILLLRQDSLASHYPLNVQVHDGVVRLTGRAASVDDIDHAMSVLGELPGVVDVEDHTTLDSTLA